MTLCGFEIAPGEKQQVKIKKGHRRQPFAKEVIRYSTVTDFARLRG